MVKKWIIDVQENEEGDAFIEFPEDFIDDVGWQEGDTIEWKNNNDGSYTLNKVEVTETEWVLVETISSFRHRYIVEVPVGKGDWALDTVTMDQAKEFSQKHVGENIVSHRAISLNEALQLCDCDNGYLKEWTDEQKIKAFFTKKEEYTK